LILIFELVWAAVTRLLMGQNLDKPEGLLSVEPTEESGAMWHLVDLIRVMGQGGATNVELTFTLRDLGLSKCYVLAVGSSYRPR